MLKKFKQKNAILMILLLVMLPFYVSSVHAELLSVEARGIDNIFNVIREDDFINFKAVATFGDEDITPNQVVLGTNLEFDSCVKGIVGFDCALRLPASGTNTFDPRAIPYSISLKSPSGEIIDTKGSSFIVDGLPPKVTDFEAEEISGNIVFNYKIEDESCPGSGCPGKCSGIEKLEISNLAGFKETVSIKSSSCVFSGKLEKPLSSFLEGQQTIVATAFDKFSQPSSQASLSLKIDSKAPLVDKNTFKIADSSGLDVNFIGKSQVPVTVKVNIIGSDLDSGTVFADLSELNKAGFQNEKGTCKPISSEAAECSWRISLNPGTAGLKTVKITAADFKGNKADTLITRNFGLDTKGPAVISLVSSRVFNGQSHAKLRGNTFTALLNEEGIGLNPKDMKLHFGNSVKNADSCNLVFNTWQCVWNNVNLNKQGKVAVFLDKDSKDRLGNSLASRFSREVIVDDTRPLLLKLVIKNIGGTEAAIEGFAKTGDKLQVEAAVADESIASASADFSRFIFNAKNVSASCADTGNETFVCSWTTPSIDIEGFIDDFIRFEFVDVAGNTLSVDKKLTVLGVDGETGSDFWQAQTRCSPSLLDRETLSLVNQRSFCQVSLQPKTSDALTTLAINLGACSGDLGSVEGFELLNNEAGSTEPFIKVNLRKQTANFNQLDFVCPLSIISKKGKEVFTTPETENINFTFKFYNLPLGELSDSVQKKIDDAVDDADNVLKVATFLKKVIFYAERICQFKNIWQRVVVTLQLFTSTFAKSIEAASFLDPATYGILNQIRVGSCFATEGAHKAQVGLTDASGATEKSGFWSSFDKFCSAINCKAGKAVAGDGTFDKWASNLGGGWGVSTLDNFLGAGRVKDIGNGNIEVVNPGLPGVGAGWTGKNPFGPGGYMNVKDSLVLSTLTVCIPGIVHNLDKARQIQCLYADCLQTGVGEEGLPVFACEDQKDYATCKYVVGEIFKVIPFTAFFNFYANLVRDTLSNPFKIIGAGLAAYCESLCQGPSETPHTGCIGIKIASLLGETIGDIQGIVDQGAFTIRDDYCDRLEFPDEEEDTKKK